MKKVAILLKTVRTAPQAGKAWEPQLHFTGSAEEDDTIAEILQSAVHHLDYYYLYPPLPGFYSLELQFKLESESQKVMGEVRQKYQALPTAETDETED